MLWIMTGSGTVVLLLGWLSNTPWAHASTSRIAHLFDNRRNRCLRQNMHLDQRLGGCQPDTADADNRTTPKSVMVAGRIAVCDECGDRWIPETENPPNCPSKKARSTPWDKAGIDGGSREARIKAGRSRKTAAKKAQA
jgi:hypothetical protein